MKQQFDLWDGGGEGALDVEAQSPPKTRVRGVEDEIELVRQLGGHGPLSRSAETGAARDRGCAAARFPLWGVIVDTETTGLNARKDEIIEIGIVAFSFDEARC